MPRLWVNALTFLWSFYCLWGLTGTGFISDDSVNSQVSGEIALSGMSIWEYAYEKYLWWVRTPGRFMPLAFYSYPLLHYVQSLFVYKILTIAVSATNVLLFSEFFRRLSGSWVMAMLFGLITPICFQFRAWHDPFLAFTFLPAMATFYFLVALVLFESYWARPLPRSRFASAFFYVLALLTYEVTYLCIGCFLLLAWHRTRNWRSAFRVSLPFWIGWGAVVSVTLLLKTPLNSHYINEHSGASLSLDLSKISTATLIQAVSGLPLSYYFRVRTHVRQWIGNGDIAVFAFLFALLLWQFRAWKGRVSGLYLVFGAFLAVAPALVMGLSGYQDILIEAGLGFGYLAVYLQYFGVATLLVCSSLKVMTILRSKLLRSGAAALISAVFVTIAFYHLGQNRSVAMESNKLYLYPRQVFESALAHGIMTDLPENALIFRRYVYPHDHLFNFVKVTQRKDWSIQEPENLLLGQVSGANFCLRHPVEGPVYGIAYAFDSAEGKFGAFYLAKIASFTRDCSDPKSPRLKSVGVNHIRAFDYRTGQTRTLPLNAGEQIEFKDYLERSALPPLNPADLSLGSRRITEGRK